MLDAVMDFLSDRIAPRRSPWLILLLAALWPAPAAAQFDGPRSYWKAPVNTHSIGLWYLHITGNSSFSAIVFDRDATVTSNVGVLSYNGYFGLFGRSAIGLALMPGGHMDFELTGGPQTVGRTSNGLADALAIFDVNLIGAPAMNLREFAAWRNRTVIDFNFAVKAPTGAYDPDRLINLGSNRWAVRFGFPLTQGIGAWKVGKRTTFELYPYLWLFTDNDDFAGGRTQAQDPMVQIETHLTRDITRALWASVGYLYLGGGGTEVDDGPPRSGSLDGHYIGGTLAAQFTSSGQLIAIYGGTIGNGGIDYTMLRVQLQFSFNPDMPE